VKDTSLIRWMQRFSNYHKALTGLSEAIQLMKERELTKLEKQGTIQAFEYTHELAWKVMKNFLESKGVSNLFGSKDVTKEAFILGLIEDGGVWMRMIQSRNISSHTYDESIANEIIMQIKKYYYSKFVEFEIKMNTYVGESEIE